MFDFATAILAFFVLKRMRAPGAAREPAAADVAVAATGVGGGSAL